MYQVSTLGITDTYAVQILPFVASPLYIFLFYNYFKEVPVSLAENAELEGASFWQIYKNVYLPLNKSPIITVCILQGMDMWNQYLWPLLVTTDEKVRPMSVAISSFTGTGGDIYWDQLMAASVVMLLPVLLLFIFFQRYFVESVASSAIKGKNQFFKRNFSSTSAFPFCHTGRMVQRPKRIFRIQRKSSSFLSVSSIFNTMGTNALGTRNHKRYAHVELRTSRIGARHKC